MRWSKAPSTQYPAPSSHRKAGYWVLSTGYWVLLAGVTLLSAALSALPSALPYADEKHIAVYSPVASYSIPVLDRSGREYVGLLELLEPLGRVSTQSDGRRLRLRYNAVY